MKRKRIGLVIKTLAIIVLLAGFGVLIQDATDRFGPRYDALAPTDVKFREIKQWIPKGAEFEAVVDVPRVLAGPVPKDYLLKFADTLGGVTSELARALIVNEGAIGMVALVGSLGEIGKTPSLAVIAQGTFNEEKLIPSIRTILSTGRAGLTSEKLGELILYKESDRREPFGFILLGDGHIAIGERASLVYLFKDGFDPPPEIGPPINSPAFGHLTIGPRLKAILPQALSVIRGVDFQSPDGRRFVATIPSGNASEAQNLRMFLEGLRSLLLLQEEGNVALAKLLGGVAIQASDTKVTIEAEILSLHHPSPSPLP